MGSTIATINYYEKIISLDNIYCFSKNKQGIYLFCNDNFAEAAGADSPSQVVGKTDDALVWKKQKDFFQDGDRKAIWGNPLVNEKEIQIQENGIKEILTTKIALTNHSSRIVGVVGSFIELPQEVDKAIGHYNHIKDGVQLDGKFNNVFLTRRNIIVYYWLMKNKKPPQIACIIDDLTLDGVWYHIRSLYQKLGLIHRVGHLGYVIAAAKVNY